MLSGPVRILPLRFLPAWVPGTDSDVTSVLAAGMPSWDSRPSSGAALESVLNATTVAGQRVGHLVSRDSSVSFDPFPLNEDRCGVRCVFERHVHAVPSPCRLDHMMAQRAGAPWMTWLDVFRAVAAASSARSFLASWCALGVVANAKFLVRCVVPTPEPISLLCEVKLPSV